MEVMADCAAAIALVDMAAQGRSAASDDGAPRLGLAAGERMPGKVGLPLFAAQDVGQLDAAASGHYLRPRGQFGQ